MLRWCQGITRLVRACDFEARRRRRILLRIFLLMRLRLRRRILRLRLRIRMLLLVLLILHLLVGGGAQIVLCCRHLHKIILFQYLYRPLVDFSGRRRLVAVNASFIGGVQGLYTPGVYLYATKTKRTPSDACCAAPTPPPHFKVQMHRSHWHFSSASRLLRHLLVREHGASSVIQTLGTHAEPGEGRLGTSSERTGGLAEPCRYSLRTGQ